MYIPKHFEETDPAVLHALMRAHAFATWVVRDARGELVANHLPFLLDPARGAHGTLLGHVARANPVWQSFAGDVDSLVVFQGADAYISPAWYASKQEHGKVVPTWNYAVVHAYGRPRAVEDREWLRTLVGRLTDTHEAGLPAPWKVSDAPADYIDSMLKAIVGIEIPIARLEGKWKIGQNRNEADRRGAVAGLAAIDGDAPADMAALMRRQLEG